MKNIESLDEYFTVVRGSTPVVMVFSANWCPDCRFLDRFIDDVEKKYAGKIAMYKVDRDQFPELCETLDIMGIPSFVAYQNGNVLTRFVSKLRKTQAEVEAFLDDVLAKAEASHA
jgi:thioredoxin-like negative regulator of GroEL